MSKVNHLVTLSQTLFQNYHPFCLVAILPLVSPYAISTNLMNLVVLGFMVNLGFEVKLECNI